jgi:isopentenyl diphosphate isomerase/L-lactate dehydrogenase-like FMN-dependent dehydrogenase
MQLEVAPQALSGQAPEITRQGARLAEVAGELRGLLGVAAATGSPEAAAAAERFAQVWSQTVLLLADTVAALGAATGAAAAAYTATDAGAMPVGR